MWRIRSIFVFCFCIFIHSVSAEELLLWEDCIWVGLERNAQFRLESTKSELYPILLKEKWKQYLPKLGVHYFGIFSRNQEQIDQEYRDVRLQIQQLLYDGGDTEREKQKIEIKQLIQAEEKKLLKEKIIQNISLAYLFANKRSLIHSLYEIRLERYKFEKKKSASESELQFVPKLETKSWKQWEVDFLNKRIHAEATKENSFLELKKVMFLDPLEPLYLEPGISERLEIFPPKINVLEVDENHPLRKKNRLQIELSQLEEETLENDWKPKLVLGGYLGRNGNYGFPLHNEIYGVSLGFQTNLGGSSLASNTQNGYQSEGNGIQRIPGYGPQAVGPGENAFQSGSFGLFDEVGRDKKRFDSKLSSLQALSEKEQSELHLKNLAKSTEVKLVEGYRKFVLYLDFTHSLLQSLKQKKQERNVQLLSELDYIKAEEEVFVALEQTVEHYFQYVSTALDLVFLTGEDPFSNRFYHLHQKRVPSVFTNLLSEWKEQFANIKEIPKEPKRKKQTPFYWEESDETR